VIFAFIILGLFMLLVAARDVFVGGEGFDLAEVLLCFVSFEWF